MNFLDSYIESGRHIRSKAARHEFYGSIIDYFVTGEEPTFKSEAAEVAFYAAKYLLDKSRTGLLAYQEGCKKKNARAKRDDPTDQNAECPQGKTEEPPRAKRDDPTDQNAECPSDTPQTKERKGKEEEDAPDGASKKPAPSNAIACLKALNEVYGMAYGSMPSRNVEFVNGLPPIDDGEVRAMLRFKRDEWQGTRFQSNLTPSTIFSPEHFEQYMAQAAMDRDTPPRKRRLTDGRGEVIPDDRFACFDVPL